MKNIIAICFLTLLTSISLFSAGDSEIIKKKYGLNRSPILLEKEIDQLNLNNFKASNSIRGTTWKSYPLYGGEMTSIAIDPNNPEIVYVGTRDAGVYKTRDGGTSWNPSRIGLTFYPIRSLAIDPQNAGILYAGTDYDGIWKSTDSGATWFKSSTGLYEGSMSIFNIIIDPQNMNIIYASMAGGYGFTIGYIYKSTNGGVNWEQSDNGLLPHGDYKNAIFSLAIDPDNSDILYTGTNFDGVFMSTDSGKIWNGISDSLPFMGEITDPYYATINALAVDQHHGGRASAIIEGHYYIFNGSYWQLKCSDFINESIDCAHLYFYPTDTSIIYSSGDCFAKSIDGGDNWNDYLGWNSCSQVPDIAFNSSTPATIYAATDILFNFDGGVFKSTDQGENWNENSDGITATVISSVAIDPQNINRIYAGEGNGHFYRSEDGGTNWYHEYFDADEFTGIKVDPANSANIYLASLTGLYKSSDFGDNFDIISEVANPKCIAINLLSSNTIYVGSSLKGIYKTTNGGTTWEQKNEGLPEFIGGIIKSILSIAINPNDTSIVWAGTQYNGGIFKSTNNGDDWVSKGLTGEDMVDCIAINPNNSNEILVGSEGYSGGNIYKSTDGGENWVKKDSEIACVFDIKYDPRNPEYVYAATEGYGVLRSTDGGETWHDYSDGIFYPVLYSLDIAQGDSVLLIAGSYSSGLYYIHPELSGINEQEIKKGLSFSRKSTLELSGTSTLICFNLPEAGMVSLKLYDIMGRQVAEILNGYRPAGKNEVSWNTEKIPAGIYFYNLELNGLKETQKVTFIK